MANAVAQRRDSVERDQAEILWDTLGDRHCDFSGEGCEIEPGETDEFIFDFVIPTQISKVQIYSDVENLKKWKKNIGWNKTTIYDIGKGQGDGRDKPEDI